MNHISGFSNNNYSVNQSKLINKVQAYSADSAKTKTDSSKYTNPINIDDDLFHSVKQTEPVKYEVQIKQAVRLSGNKEIDMAVINTLIDVPDEVRNATYGIIDRNLLISNVGTMTEKDRKAMISLGMEQARFISNKYMSPPQSTEYLDALGTIAKLGINAQFLENGHVRVPSDDHTADMNIYINYEEIMKIQEPDTYNAYREAADRAVVDLNSDWVDIMMNFSKKIYVDKEVLKKYATANNSEMEQLLSTELPNTFSVSHTDSYETFYQNMSQKKEQENLLLDGQFEENMDLFAHMLLHSKYFVH